MGCPNCGYCPYCGRGGYQTYPWHYYQPYPYGNGTGVAPLTVGPTWPVTTTGTAVVTTTEQMTEEDRTNLQVLWGKK